MNIKKNNIMVRCTAVNNNRTSLIYKPSYSKSPDDLKVKMHSRRLCYPSSILGQGIATIRK
jgi:hypothetical protein